ncbi:hypothetical protein [Paraburkholderia sacchari]|uniref:hypothetical protein n=1 Tax=Paraburkholderia sacchari TaxID=159450 RepID=UPI0039A47938
MHTEKVGHYEVELSARQFIHNGGWAAFAAIHDSYGERGEQTECAAVLPEQRVADETVFASEAAAIAGARQAALVMLGDLGTVNPPR